MSRFVAFDVETPNAENNRMSAIGIAVIEEGAVLDSFASLVNPETYFLPFNVALTGITPQAAEKAPAFDALWERIGPLLSSGILLAHNAPFDMGVLARCLRAYGIDFERYVPYACTVRMGRRLLPGLPDHRLNTMCAHYGIPLDHHRADSDSLACAELFLRYRQAGLSCEPFLRWFDMQTMRTLKPKEAAALLREGTLPPLML